MSLSREDYDRLQFAKYPRTDSFLEVCGDSLSFENIRLGFRTYDNSGEAGQKILQSIDIFIDSDELLLLSHDILSGRITKQLAINQQTAKETGDYPEPAYKLVGGTSAKKLSDQGKSRPDGKSLSRQFTIELGKNGVIFKAVSGAGTQGKNGLIVPAYNGSNPEQKIVITMPAKDMKKFALVSKAAVESFISTKILLTNDLFLGRVTKAVAQEIKKHLAPITDLFLGRMTNAVAQEIKKLLPPITDSAQKRR